MKRALLLMLLAGCTGNWSNKDLEYLSALPSKAELQSKLPTGSATNPLSGEGTRRDPLGIGEASQAYLDAKKASTDFNGLLDGLLSIVEAVRAYPPTSRTSDSRTWGPFDDDKNVGYQSQLVIARVDAANFGWAIQSRLKQGPGEWFDVVTGSFVASSGIRKGKGKVTLFIAQNASKLKTLQAFLPISEIQMGYQTDIDPILVGMAFTFGANDAGYSELGYGYQEDTNKAGKMNFGLRTTDVNVTLLNTTAQWVPSGAGFATANVAEGAYTGANAKECWDTAFKTVYVFQSWPGGVNLGSESTCVAAPF